MPTTIKRAQVWRTEVDHTPGQLASVLGPLAAAGADLQVVMAYRLPGQPSKAVVEVYPVAGKKQAMAAATGSLAAAGLPVMLVEGDNRAGLGARIADVLATAGINIAFLVAQTVGRKYTAVFGFENDADAKKASTLIKKAGAPARKTVRKR
jgi:hypothetical protein